MSSMLLPPGFRFHPTDEELIDYYLKRKVNGLKIELEVIPVVDLCKFDPWELPDKSFLPGKDMEWFFFYPHNRKYPNGSRTNRTTVSGYWKATGKDRKISCESCVFGLRKTLVFYLGRAPGGERTDWIMHEHRLCEDLPNGTTNFVGDFALCRVMKRNGRCNSPAMSDFKHKRNLERQFVETVGNVDGIYRDRERENPKSVSSPLVYADVKERALPGSYPVRVLDQHRARSPMYPEVNEKQTTGYLFEGVRPTSSDGAFSGSKLHKQGATEVFERPKLKLLPRRKPLESQDIQNRDFDDKQAYQVSMNSEQVHNAHEVHGNLNLPKPESAGADEGHQAIERPKLNLKPRSQTIEQSEGSADRERKNVFGGARPRELVLKERGIDIEANEVHMIRSSNRTRNDLLKIDQKTEPNSSTQLGERAERLSVGQRTAKDPESKGYHPDNERVDMQNALWRNDHRKNSRESDKPLERPRADTDNWRKSVIENQKPEVPGPRFGKGASALELAQAFSRSVSDARPENKVPVQKQLPFSRLTGTKELYSGTTHRQINGY